MKNWNVIEWAWAILYLVFLGLFSLGQLARIVLTPTIAIYGHDIVVVIGCVGICLTFGTQILKNISKLNPKNFILESLLVIWIVVGLIVATMQNQNSATALLYLSRLLAYSFFIWGSMQLSFWQKLPRALLGLNTKRLSFFLIGLVITYFGFLQYVLIPDTRFLGILGWDNHYYRLIGTQLDPAFTGMLLVLTLILGLGIKKLAWLKWLLILLITLAIALTFSRASYLALAFGVGFWGIKTGWRRKQISSALLVIPLLLLFLPFLPKPGGEGVNLVRTATITSRVANSQQNLLYVQPYQWLIGRGLFIYQPDLNVFTQEENHARLPDNIVVLLINSIGLGGCLLVAAIVYQRRQHFMQLSTTAQASLIAALVHAQFNNTLLQPFVWLFLWGILFSEDKSRKTDSTT